MRQRRFDRRPAQTRLIRFKLELRLSRKLRSRRYGHSKGGVSNERIRTASDCHEMDEQRIDEKMAFNQSGIKWSISPRLLSIQLTTSSSAER